MVYGVNVYGITTTLMVKIRALTHRQVEIWYIYIPIAHVAKGIDLDSSSTPWWRVQQYQQAHDGRRGTKL